MAQLVVNRYAEALFSLAIEENAIDTYESEIRFIYETLNENKDFLLILNHPRIPSDEKFSKVANIFTGKISDSILGLLNLIFRKSRQTYIMDILEVFLSKVKDYRGIISAEVYSAVALTDAQISEIADKLSKNLNKQVEIQSTIDKELIGGIKIKVDGKVIDGTIKKQIDDLKNNLLNLQIL